MQAELWAFAIILTAVLGFLSYEAANFRRARMARRILCECSHPKSSHKGDACSECACFFFYPVVRLVAEEDLLSKEAKRAYRP